MKTYLSVEHHPVHRLMLHALLLLLLALPAALGQEVDLSRLNALKSYRTPSRRFVVLGPEMFDNLEAGRWAETVGNRVEEVIGGPLPFSRREVRIVIRPSENTATGTVAVADCAPIALTQRWESGRLVQRMVIPAVQCLGDERVRLAFCRLLMEGFFPSSHVDSEPVLVPRWLIIGLDRNLQREQRGEDAFAMVERWRQGSVPTLADWLGRDSGAWDAPADESMSALLLAWLVDPPDGYTRLGRLLSHLNKGTTIGSDLLALVLLGEGAAPADLEVAWDGWIMRQQRKVFRPGTTPPDVVKQLSAELLLYPGAFGIPLASDIERGSGFAALIERRKADWIATFCRIKLASLRALAVGRGPAVQQAVEQYGAFLDALERGKRTSLLRKLLAEAEDAMRELDTVVLGVADGADHDSTDTENAGR
jgi:hypothetical protein